MSGGGDKKRLCAGIREEVCWVHVTIVRWRRKHLLLLKFIKGKEAWKALVRPLFEREERNNWWRMNLVMCFIYQHHNALLYVGERKA